MQNQDGTVSPDSATTIRNVNVNRGVEWITGGFNLFMKKPGEWLIAGLGLFVISFVLGWIPMVGSAAATLVGVVAVGAFFRACQAIEAGQDPIVAAQNAAGNTNLIILGLIGAAIAAVISVVSWALAFFVFAAFMASPTLGVGMIFLAPLVAMVLSLPLIMATWLAPGLVVLKGTAPLDAVRLSFSAAIKNFLPFIIFFFLGMIACIAGGLLMGVGLIFVYPLLICGAYVAFKDIFGAVAIGEAVGHIEQAH